jgi:hypothetical protein
LTVIHARELPRRGPAVKEHGGSSSIFVLLLLVFGLVLSGCKDPTSPSDTERFGLSGEVRIEVRTPIGGRFNPATGVTSPTGYLAESLIWRSTGPWVLAERVSYRGLAGSETVHTGRFNPGELAAEYEIFNLELHESTEVGLFGGDVPQIEPVCSPNGVLSSQVTITIYDAPRDRTERWIRCARGTLFTLLSNVGGPDLAAGRVVNAIRRARSFTLGDDLVSTYDATVPYGTHAQGERSRTLPDGPIAFVSSTGSVPPAFLEFWEEHAEPGDFLPSVDWANEIVFFAAVGERGEAGGSVHIRRVLNLPGQTRVEISERVPGDFCTPAAKVTFPYHLVVVPTVPTPVEFFFPPTERVPCGL